MNIVSESDYSDDFNLVLRKIFGSVIDDLVFHYGSFENIEELRAAVRQAILDCAAAGQSDPAQIARCAIAWVKVRTDDALRPARIEHAAGDAKSTLGQ